MMEGLISNNKEDTWTELRDKNIATFARDLEIEI